MHPREGWSEGGRRLPTGMSRRDFLSRVGIGAAAGGLLAACGSPSKASPGGSTTSASAGGGVPLPRPNHPVKWPLFSGNEPIKSGLAPEKGATLQIYNWVAYINESVVKNFCKKYQCKYQITTFNTMEEAIAKLASGQLKFDIFFPTIDEIGPLVEEKLMRPLNHSYIPNIANAWPDYQNPFYDQGWQYSVPYTIYTTGMAWRKDHVPENPYTMANPWAMPWQSKYKGKVAILDDYREGLSLALMKNGIFDLNTTSASQIAAAGQQLRDLQSLVSVRIDNNDYTDVPSGKTWIHEAWSGDIAAAPAYLPKGTPVDVVGYWFPANGKGPVNNDLITVLAGGQNPVLAHLFQNYLLDSDNAIENYSYTGYMQPLTAITPQRLVAEKLLPTSLMSTVVLPSYFRRGVLELELPAQANLAWEQTWNSFSKGL